MPEELAEPAYRRGYNDGWLDATSIAWEIMFMQKKTRQEAYDMLHAFGYGPLHEWYTTYQHDERPVFPPQM